MDPEIIRTRVSVNKETVTNVSSTDFPGTWPGFDDAYDLQKFKNNLKIVITRKTDMEMEFDLIGVDASFANALRRILIAEVATVAIETVYLFENSSCLQDEVLCHRLGLLPIKADPALFNMREKDETPTDLDTIVFDLNVKCTGVPSKVPGEKYENDKVYSKHLIWVPQGEQEERFKDNPIRPVYDDILIAKLGPGQEINVQLHCQKGIGEDHAKFSPVATASYRLFPEIVIKQDITGEDAVKFAKCFPPGTIKIVTENNVKKAVVQDPRKCTMSRECLRHPEFENKVELRRVRDHFLFSIETTGMMTPETLMREAFKILLEKCDRVKQDLVKMEE